MAIATQAAALQNASPALGTVSRRPQTTAEPSAAAEGGVPFTRLSAPSKILGFQQSGVPFGGIITQSLKAVGGYLRGLRLRITSQNFTSTAAVVAAADAPWNIFSSIFMRDPQGQPILTIDGYSAFLINLFSGQCGSGGMQDPRSRPSFAALQTASGAGAGGFALELFLPLEFDSAAYCCLTSMNASSQPSLQINLSASGALYSTAPTTLGSFTVTVTEEFWSTPVAAPTLAPPGVGSSAQWSLAPCAQSVSSQYTRLTWPRVGTYIHTMIAVMRDSTGARAAGWPVSDLTFSVDGVPRVIEWYQDRQDDIFEAFNESLPTGVAVWTFRQSIERMVSSADTHDVLLSTTPATLLEIAGTYNLTANAPGIVTAITGELYPVDGIPYTHLQD